MTTIEQLGGLTAQHNEIIKRVVNGTLNPISVKRALQDIIEKVSATPSITERVEQQLTAWRNLGLVISDEQWEQILQQADTFEPFTDSDEPLVSGGFGYNNPTALVKKLFGAFTPPDGYTKVSYIEDAQLRYAPGHKPTGQLRLVHYDPNAYAGLSPEAAREQAKTDKLRLAGIEVYESLILEPRSGLTWDGKLYFFPNASGLDRKYEGAWSRVPCLDRWDGGRRFEFHSDWADYVRGIFSSPVVREC